jgi:hypothetical protein
LIVLAKNYQMFCIGKGIDHVKVVGTELNIAGVSYSLLPWLPLLLCSVKYEQEETVEHQQTKGLSREHHNCSSNEVVFGWCDCFGCITMMYQQHITVNL